MNSAHDLGGQMGFGPVEPEPNEPIFHADWEKRVLAINVAAGAMGGWTIDDVPTTGQKQLLLRFRMASADERAWIRTALREHLADWFPEIQAP